MRYGIYKEHMDEEDCSQMSLISVVVPVYNVCKYLERCIESILAQTMKEYDLFLVDDGSTDDSGAICDRYADKYAFVHVIHQSNCGLSSARNSGIEWSLAHSDSQYLTFIDSDDWVHPQYLEFLYAAIQRDGCGAAVGGFIKTSADTEFSITDAVQPRTLPPAEFYCENVVNFIVAWGKLYRKSDFAQLRYPEGKLHEDEFTTWKILFKYDRITVIDLPVYAYFQRADSIVSAGWRPERLAGIDAMEEQKAWIDQYGNERLKQWVRQRLAVDCAKNILGMKQVGADRKMIRCYKARLKGYIRDAQPALPFGKYYIAYRTAWPMGSRIVWFIYRVCGKVAQILKDLKSGA